MKTDPGTGVLSPFRFDRMAEEVPELQKFGHTLDTIAFDPPIDSSDITVEAALAKLMVLLGGGLSDAEVREALKMSIRGEITV